MGPEANKKIDPELLSESERRIFQIYGRVRGGQMKERKYFDSGDLALSAATRETDNGAINTGVDYPQRENISRPHAPVPQSSNVNDGANEKFDDQKRGDAEMVDSPLHQHTESNEKT